MSALQSSGRSESSENSFFFFPGCLVMFLSWHSLPVVFIHELLSAYLIPYTQYILEVINSSGQAKTFVEKYTRYKIQCNKMGVCDSPVSVGLENIWILLWNRQTPQPKANLTQGKWRSRLKVALGPLFPTEILTFRYSSTRVTKSYLVRVRIYLHLLCSSLVLCKISSHFPLLE